MVYKVVALVRDNAANMVSASRILEEWDDLPCFAHTLQLAVKAGLDLPVINRLSAICRKIVGHFKHSVLASGVAKGGPGRACAHPSIEFF